MANKRPTTVVKVTDYDAQTQTHKGEVTLQLFGKQTFFLQKMEPAKEGMRQDGTPRKIVGTMWIEGSEKPYPGIFEETNQRGNVERKCTVMKKYDPSERKEKGVVYARVKRAPSTTETAAYEVEFSERPGSNEWTSDRPQIVKDTAIEKDPLPF